MLRIEPSTLNLTALNGNYAGPAGQAFVGRRQSHTLFSFRVDLDFTPTQRDEEAGVSAFLTQNHHLDMGVVLLNASEATGTFPWVNSTIPMGNATAGPDDLVPMVRFRGISYVPVPSPVILPLPPQWRRQRLTLEIRAPNTTHYVFAIGPADSRSDVVDIIAVDNTPVSWGFTGVLLGVYATTNGGEGGDGAGGAVSWWSRWRYDGWAQLRD